jgi:hypothetical protein
MMAENKAKKFKISDSSYLPFDSSMVLRILLEFYRNEKKAKAFIFKRLFKEHGNEKIGITFNQF